MKTKWSKSFPKEAGDYWFYGYRYGKISCGYAEKPEWKRVQVRKIANGMLYNAEGQFLYENEVEEARFCPIEYPEPPIINEELSEGDKAKLLKVNP